MASRHAIPRQIERDVYVRFNFHCFECLQQLKTPPTFHHIRTEKDHTKPFAIFRDHKSDELVLLCPNHHNEKTHIFRTVPYFDQELIIARWDQKRRRQKTFTLDDFRGFMEDKVKYLAEGPSTLLSILWKVYCNHILDLPTLKFALWLEADALRRQGRLHIAIDLLNLAERFENASTPTDIKTNIYITRAKALTAIGAPHDALRLEEEIFKHLKKYSQSDHEKILNFIITRQNSLMQSGANINHLSKALLEYDWDTANNRQSYPLAHAMLVNSEAGNYRISGDYECAARLHKSSEKMFLDFGDVRGAAMCRGNVARAYLMHGQPLLAANIVSEAIANFQQTEDSWGECANRLTLANCFLSKAISEAKRTERRARYTQKAQVQFSLAIEYLESSYDLHLRPRAWDGLASCWSLIEHNTNAKICHAIAYRLRQERQDPRWNICEDLIYSKMPDGNDYLPKIINIDEKKLYNEHLQCLVYDP